MKNRMAWGLAVVLAVLVLGGVGILIKRTYTFTVIHGGSTEPLDFDIVPEDRHFLAWGHMLVIWGRRAH
jgi:hypothetical protein